MSEELKQVETEAEVGVNAEEKVTPLAIEPETAEQTVPMETPVETVVGSKRMKVVRCVVLTFVGIVIMACGMLTGAWMQRKSGDNSWSQLNDDLMTGGLTDENGQVDLTTSLLLSQLEKQKEKGGTSNKIEIAADQLVDGSGGGKLVGSVALIPQSDKLTVEFLKLHNAQENTCYSPLSIRYALEMLSYGADGKTKTQIEELLGGIKATKYEDVAGHVSVANALWVRNGFADEVKTSYKNIIASEVGAEVRQNGFQDATEVNAWIEDKSFGMLKDILPDNGIRNLNALLMNVLAIDMNWEKEFEETFTRGEYFNWDDTKNEYENEKYTTLEGFGGASEYYNLAADATLFAKDLKEYDGTKLQFVAIMPKEDLATYIQNINVEQINRLLVGMRRAEGQNDTYKFSFKSYIPKFSMQSGIRDLVADLKILGVTDAFDKEKANLSKITDGDFWIDSATHETNFDFSEEGIKAAAVTAFGGLGGGGAGPIPSSSSIVVSINRPFMYLVRDVDTGEVWFAGTVYEPNLWENDRVEYGCTNSDWSWCW